MTRRKPPARPSSGIVDLARMRSAPSVCAYLPQETSSLEYRIVGPLDEQHFGELLRRGWRRFGDCFFRPACPFCTACRSLRVDVRRFSPSKSQRRVLRQNADVQLIVRPPTVTPEHLRVFNAYHADMHARRGWPLRSDTPEEYYQSFLAGEREFAREFLYLRDGRLIGVGLVDQARDGLSSAYFYHDPEWRDLSPGTYSALREIQYAQETSRHWLYLGYWIAACASMSYKNRFHPHEILERYPADDEEPQWLAGHRN